VIATPGSLDPAGPVGRAAADLWWLMLALGVAVFVLFAVLLAASLLRRPGDDEVDTTADGGRLVRRWIVGGGVLLPLVIITVVFGATLVAMRDTPRASASEDLVIEIVGHQFWYEIRYPGADVVTANELHIPVGRPVSFELTSVDVIHSFWVPALGGKMDMMPDGTNTLVLQADEPGEHRSRCAEFCGLQHTRMGMVVVAEPEEDFAAWLEAQRAPAAEPADEVAARGQEVFLAADCASCHAVRGAGAEGVDGPDLTHLGSRRTLAAATLPNDTEHLTAWLTDPQAVKAGVDMPAAELSADELAALVAYLEGLE
jgi:cytochrome c oxidase subunit II